MCDSLVCVVSKGGNALVFPLSEVPVLKAAGKGVTGIKIEDGDQVFACELVTNPELPLVVVDDQAREYKVAEGPMRLGGRGDKGRSFFRRGEFVEWRSKKPFIQVGEQAPVVGEA